jgi:SIR2-like protein
LAFWLLFCHFGAEILRIALVRLIAVVKAVSHISQPPATICLPIMADPRIEKAAEATWAFIKDRDCVAWMGSGLSTPCGYPSWETAVDELCKRCLTEEALPPKPDAGTMLDLADKCRKVAPRQYLETLDELFGHPPQLNRNAYSYILGCPFTGFVTTNFDPLLYVAGVTRELVAYPDALYLTHVDHSKVVYMHGIARRNGVANSSSLIFSRLDFDKAYENHPLSDFMRQMLCRDKALFIGCRLGEEYIEHVFQQVRKMTKTFENIPQRSRRILVAEVDDVGQAAEEERALCEVGIEVIRYPKLDDDHTGLDLVLERVWNSSQSRVIDHGEDLPS